MLEFTYVKVQCDAAYWRLANLLRNHWKAASYSKNRKEDSDGQTNINIYL